ncbi:GRN protein, partial [Erpornis zantholeuca]|nr:GRN protein [Erpornis zantholeuca]
PQSVPCAGGHRCCPQGSQCSTDGESCVTELGTGARLRARLGAQGWGTGVGPPAASCQSFPPLPAFWGALPDPLCPPPLLSPQSVPCAGGHRCCPQGSQCSTDGESCVTELGTGARLRARLGAQGPAWKRQPSAPVAPRQVLCPDGRSACPDGATCCQLSPAHYGCCPLQNAVCCSDGQHCCPQGTTCDLVHSTCTSLGGSAPLAALPTARDVKCDEETSCPNGNTCCRLSSGAWGCCPLEQ